LIYVSINYLYLTSDKSNINISIPRGEIYDTNGILLASNFFKYSVYMDPSAVSKVDYYADLFERDLGVDKTVFYSNFKK